MRVVGGKYKGRRFSPPKKFPSRPTTDFAKEALFNILQNRLDWEDCDVLDLFAGTGNISLEFISRGAKSVISVDNHRISHQFIRKTQSEFGDDNWMVLRKDAFAYCEESTASFDLIIADPPFGLNGIEEMIDQILSSKLLKDGGLLIVEHGQENNFENRTHFQEIRKYGGVNFSFFSID